jgi:hypothetical protein
MMGDQRYFGKASDLTLDAAIAPRRLIAALRIVVTSFIGKASTRGGVEWGLQI